MTNQSSAEQFVRKTKPENEFHFNQFCGGQRGH